MTLAALIRDTLRYYESAHRNYLPWRNTSDPYRVLVSEIMLQQTQVDRVEVKYRTFLRRFPTVRVLARSRLAEVLLLWQGLGYNRRAKFLHDTAREVVTRYKGIFPAEVTALETLPGVGPYTARAIRIFALNAPEVCIETNIRTVFMHYCFPQTMKVKDAELMAYIKKALTTVQRKGISPRIWYAALMDYGSHLKKTGLRLNSKSTQYRKQTVFRGSARELRGEIIRALIAKPCSLKILSRTLKRSEDDVSRELSRLMREHILLKRGTRFVFVE